MAGGMRGMGVHGREGGMCGRGGMNGSGGGVRGIRSMSGRSTSYWNAFFFIIDFTNSLNPELKMQL